MLHNPLYGTKLDIIFDKKIKLSRRSFWEKYGICNKGIAPKRLKIRKEIEEKEVVALFGPCNCNKYKYYHTKDEALISRVETLWMIMHQRMHLPNTQMINNTKACEIAYEIKTWKKVNWCMLAKWTIRDQLYKLQSLEVILCDKLRHGIHLDSFVGLNKEEEEEEGLMPYSSSMPIVSSKQMHVLGESLSSASSTGKITFFNLQKDLPTIEEIVSSLQKVKEEAQNELKKFYG
jgi:hypothetical protein